MSSIWNTGMGLRKWDYGTQEMEHWKWNYGTQDLLKNIS